MNGGRASCGMNFHGLRNEGVVHHFRGPLWRPRDSILINEGFNWRRR
jgi:hypothetical protein